MDRKNATLELDQLTFVVAPTVLPSPVDINFTVAADPTALFENAAEASSREEPATPFLIRN